MSLSCHIALYLKKYILAYLKEEIDTLGYSFLEAEPLYTYPCLPVPDFVLCPTTRVRVFLILMDSQRHA